MKQNPMLMLATACVILGVGWLKGLPREFAEPATRVTSVSPQTPVEPAVQPKRHLGRALAASGATQARLTGVSIRSEGDGEETSIHLAITRLTPYRVLHLEDPNRLVLDLEGARNGTSRWDYLSHSPHLLRVRLGRFSEQYGGVLRVVADLEGNPPSHVERAQTGFQIDLGPRDHPGRGARAGVSVETGPKSPVARRLPLLRCPAKRPRSVPRRARRARRKRIPWSSTASKRCPLPDLQRSTPPAFPLQKRQRDGLPCLEPPLPQRPWRVPLA